MDKAIAWNSGLDADAIASAFARDGRVHIPAILTEENAGRLYRCLKTETAFAEARDGDHYHHDGHVLSHAGEYYSDTAHYLFAVTQFLNSPPFLDLARRITGNAAIAFADAQATRYQPGHFCSRSDDINGSGTIAAYVLNMTPRWRPDWGGALLFSDRPGHISGGYLPTFNMLNILAPQDHMVGLVSPFAGAHRLSITGWFRTRP